MANGIIVGDEVARVGSGLAALGLKQGQFTSIYANTRAEWHIAAQGCFAQGFPIATCYASLGEEAVAYSLNESKVTLVVSEMAVVDTVYTHFIKLLHIFILLQQIMMPNGMNVIVN
jgi:long-subunit acyl-CoA synthetase (AMP-forming)